MMLDMISNIITYVIHRSIVGIGGLTRDELKMFRNEVATYWVQRASNNTPNEEIKKRLPSQEVKNSGIKSVLNQRHE
jgi:hypothetical protein